MDGALRIGELAERAHVSIDAIRYYERRGLLPRAPRTAGGYRLFPASMVERLRFIKQAQELGFSLDEIGILGGSGSGAECVRVHELLTVKLAELDGRLRRMREFRQTLAGYLAECEEELSRHANSPDCPVVAEITNLRN